MALNFITTDIDHKKYTSTNSKINKITVNPITYHLTIEIEGIQQAIQLDLMRTPTGGYNAIIKDLNIQGTITDPLNVTHSESDSAVKSVLNTWEKLFLEKLEKQ